jgi:hypothetical protein
VDPPCAPGLGRPRYLTPLDLLFLFGSLWVFPHPHPRADESSLSLLSPPPVRARDLEPRALRPDPLACASSACRRRASHRRGRRDGGEPSWLTDKLLGLGGDEGI